MLILLGSPAGAHGPAPALQRFEQTHPAMGTLFTLELYAHDEQSAGAISASVFDEIDRIESLLSNYRASSEVSRISREASLHSVVTDPETFAFLERSLLWSQRSSGAFDITVGPLLRAWGFFFNTGHVPAASQLDAHRAEVGWQAVHLDPVTRQVSFTHPRELDPGSIGKGFAVDRVVSLLREQGVTAALVSAGSSTVYGLGAPPDSAGWRVNIPDPHHQGRFAATVLLRDTSLSTGACTEKYFVQNGHRYCHIFDPRSGHPVENVLQASVIDPSATDSDALSTVVFVLEPSAAVAVMHAIPTAQALVFGNPPERPGCLAINWKGNPCPASAPHTGEDLHP